MLHDGSVCDSNHMHDREQRASADRRWASSLVRPALISSEGSGLPYHLTHLPSTKLLKLNHQASCLWAFGRQNQTISSPLRIWSTGAGSGVCSPQAFIEHFLLPGFLQELLSQETCLSCSLLLALVSDSETELQTNAVCFNMMEVLSLKESCSLLPLYFWRWGLSNNRRLVSEYS